MHFPDEAVMYEYSYNAKPFDYSPTLIRDLFSTMCSVVKHSSNSRASITPIEQDLSEVKARLKTDIRLRLKLPDFHEEGAKAGI